MEIDRTFREIHEAAQYRNWMSRDGEPEMFGRTELEEAGLVVEGDYSDVVVVSVNGRSLPVESRIGSNRDGVTETTFYPRDYQAGKEVILMDRSNPNT